MKNSVQSNLLLMSTIELLMFNHYLEVNFSSNRQWLLLEFKCLDSNIDLMIWLGSSNCVLSCNLLLSFCKYKWIGIRPATVSILNKGDI